MEQSTDTSRTLAPLEDFEMTTKIISAIRAELESLEGSAGYDDTATRRYLALEREDAIKLRMIV